MADPGSVTWAGGTVELQREHSSIHLVRERLTFELGLFSTCVTADLEFENRGPAAVIGMGFPHKAMRGPKYRPGYHLIKDMTVLCDGREVPTAEKAGRLDLDDGRMGVLWNLFEVPFEAEQGRTLVVSYTLTHTAHPQRRRIPYILTTGASWAGPLEDLTVEIRPEERGNFSRIILNRDRSTRRKPGLPLEPDGDALVWRCGAYEGDPPLLELEFDLGPAKVEIEMPDGAERRLGTHRGPLWKHLRWDRGRLMARPELLADALMAVCEAGEGGAYRLAREDVACELRSASLPTGRSGHEEGFLPVKEACEGLGAALDVTWARTGDAHITIRPSATGEIDYRKMATWPTQAAAHRLAAMAALLERQPEACAEAARECLGQESAPTEVAVAAVGCLATLGEPVDVWGLELPSLAGGRAVERVVEVTLGTEHDMVIRGGGELFHAWTPDTMSGVLVQGIDAKAARTVYRGLTRRARAAGLALRAHRPRGARAHMAALAERTPSTDVRRAAYVGLGYLGDDGGIPFLVEAAIAGGGGTDSNGPMQGLAMLRTPAAAQKLAELAVSASTQGVRQQAVYGLKAAAGLRGPQWWQSSPAWAIDMPEEEAVDVLRACCEKIHAEKIDVNGATQGVLAALDERYASAKQ